MNAMIMISSVRSGGVNGLPVEAFYEFLDRLIRSLHVKHLNDPFRRSPASIEVRRELAAEFPE